MIELARPVPDRSHFRFLPPQAFLDAFCRVEGSSSETLGRAHFADVPHGLGITVEDMYKPLVTELNKHCSPFQFYMWPLNTEGGKVGGNRIHPVLWMADNSSQIDRARTLETSTVRPHVNIDHAASDMVAVIDWSRCELTCEVTPFTWDDPFDGNTDTKTRDDLCETLLTYFMEQATRQHRDFTFQLLIFGSHARFVRWDRCQAVVSEAFDYHENPRLLAEFLWRYSRLDRTTGRGWDENVSLAGPDDANFFEQKLNEVLRTPPTDMSSGTVKTIYRALRATSESMAKDTLAGDYPTYAVRISSPYKWHIKTTLLIRRPFYQHPDAFGRATRAYLAYDMDHEEFRFFKDAWRHQELPPGCYSEEEFYTKTTALDIPDMRLPKVFFAGDVGPLSIAVDEEAQGAPTEDRLQLGTSRVHCCILQELLCPLDSFEHARELAEIILDVLKTMQAVHDTVRIIHGDISANNVMFRVNAAGNVEGVLNDWDNNRPVRTEGNDQPAVRGAVCVSLEFSPTPFVLVNSHWGPQGTLPFMAIELSANSEMEHALRHDLEATVLWVSLYSALGRLAYTPAYAWHRCMFDSTLHTGMYCKRRFLFDTLRYPNFRDAPELSKLVRQVCRMYHDAYLLTTPNVCDTSRDTEEAKEIRGRARARVGDVGFFVEMFESALAGDSLPVDEELAEVDRIVDPPSSGCAHANVETVSSLLCLLIICLISRST